MSVSASVSLCVCDARKNTPKQRQKETEKGRMIRNEYRKTQSVIRMKRGREWGQHDRVDKKERTKHMKIKLGERRYD